MLIDFPIQKFVKKGNGPLTFQCSSRILKSKEIMKNKEIIIYITQKSSTIQPIQEIPLDFSDHKGAKYFCVH